MSNMSNILKPPTIPSSDDVSTLHEQSMYKNSNKKVIYNNWSNSYDTYVDSLNYDAPHNLVKMCLPFITNDTNHTILDFGCGTGLVGMELKNNFLLNTTLTGIDISEGMIIECLKKNVYDKLFNIDITDTSYNDIDTLIQNIGGVKFDIIICCGVFLEGHLNMNIIPDILCKLLNKPGYVCFSIRDSYYKENIDFFKEIEKDSNINILIKQQISYLENVEAWGFILEVDI